MFGEDDAVEGRVEGVVLREGMSGGAGEAGVGGRAGGV